MRRVKCEDCGRVYDFDTDDFCPRCGAFTFPKGDRIGTDSSVVRVEEIRESNHKDSFLHAEYFVEKRRRKAAGLDRGADRSRGSQWAPAPGGAKTAKVSGPLQKGAERPALSPQFADLPASQIGLVCAEGLGFTLGIRGRTAMGGNL